MGTFDQEGFPSVNSKFLADWSCGAILEAGHVMKNMI